MRSGDNMDITFGELKCKEVINTVNGKRLGRITDMVISCQTCKVTGLVVPNDRRLFKSKDHVFIPWRSIVKIGDDCILVRLYETRAGFQPCPDDGTAYIQGGGE